MSLLTVLGGAQHPTLTTLSVTVQTGGSNGKLQNYSASAAVPHVGKLPPRALPIVVPPWEALPGDGSPLNNGLLYGRHFGGVPNTDTNPVLDGSGLLLYGRHAGAITGAIGQTADAFGNYIKAGVVGRNQLEVAGQPGGGNLVYNPTGSAGLNGWTRFASAGNQLAFTTDGYGGGRFIAPSGTLSANSYDGYEQTISVISNVQAVLGVILSANLPANCYAYVDVVGVQSGTALGSISFSNTTLTRSPQYTPAFSTGANTSVTLRWYLWNKGTSSATVSGDWAKLQLEYGTQPSAYVDHDAAAGHNALFTSRSAGVTSIPQLRSSTPLREYVPNSLANLVSNITIHSYSASSGSLVLWFTSTNPSSNPAGSTYPAWTWPDQSGGIYPSAAECGSSSSSPAPGMAFSNLPASVYIGIKYQPSTDTFSVVFGPSGSLPTDAQIAATVGDGSVVTVIATSTQGSPIPSGGGGASSFSGGGGHIVNKY